MLLKLIPDQPLRTLEIKGHVICTENDHSYEYEGKKKSLLSTDSSGL